MIDLTLYLNVTVILKMVTLTAEQHNNYAILNGLHLYSTSSIIFYTQHIFNFKIPLFS